MSDEHSPINIGKHQTLVIGYGNRWRRDDGMGPAIASLVANRNLPDVLVMAVQQLTPELSEPLFQAGRALFVDATAAPQPAPVMIQPLLPERVDASLTHACQPATLLSLAEILYARSPPAWLMTVTGSDFGLGDELSALARQHLAQAAQAISEWLVRPWDSHEQFQPLP